MAMTPERWEQVGISPKPRLHLPERSGRPSFGVPAGRMPRFGGTSSRCSPAKPPPAEYLNAGALTDAARIVAGEEWPWFRNGKSFGHYTVVSLLGSGGMGEVYCARDVRLGRDVAIKTLPWLVAPSDNTTRQFETEARVVASLSHPNVRALYDVGEIDGRLYTVMELLEGETLRERLDADPCLSARRSKLARPSPRASPPLTARASCTAISSRRTSSSRRSATSRCWTSDANTTLPAVPCRTCGTSPCRTAKPPVCRGRHLESGRERFP